MPPRKKREKFVGWLSRLFSTKGEANYPPDAPSYHAIVGGAFSHAQDFTLNNPVVSSVQGDHNTLTYVQGDRNLVSLIMGLLSQRIIRGAAHDSSARSPPPRCHPETRVKLIARINTWFDGQGRQELVLWITGPAGVGKSAVVQTFAEHLIKFEFLGASVFFSRPNKRDNPHGVFITIAYQLAARIDAYRDFIVERLSRDPELLSGDMQAQFRTFIAEPFAGKKIGADGRRWGILLDGLDELKGEDAQCEIIRLITAFAHEHPDVPLVWIIASRPESHISDTFDDDDVRRSCWSEYIPIDSTEACEDVDRFFRAGFNAIRKKFRRSVPPDWPNNTDYLKLTAAASGLFVYAEVVMQFIRDPEYADPASRFELLLSVIDRSNASPTKENPFVHLDTLYREILSSIPSHLWPTAKRLLRCSTYWDYVAIHDMGHLQTLRGMAILLGLSPRVIYTCLTKCQSILRVPDWKVAHKQNLTFLHASFADYLRDSSRSGEFCVGSGEDARMDIYLNVLAISEECSKGQGGAVETAWHQHCSKLDNEPPSKAVAKYHAKALGIIASLFARDMLHYLLETIAESSIHMQLLNVHMIKLSYYFDAWGVSIFVQGLMDDVADGVGLIQRVHLKDLKFGHLDWKMMSPVCARSGQDGDLSSRPRSQAALKKFVSHLESIQETSPELEVAIAGGAPQGRIAAFRNPLNVPALQRRDFMYYIVPYPE